MSFTETLVILIVAVIVFGPKRLPEMARKLGRWTGMVRRAGDEFKRQLMTMDQTVDDTLNVATDALDRLVPTDEALGEAAEDASDSEPSLPDASPDDAWDAEPVPGGLPEEAPAAEAPLPSAEAVPTAAARLPGAVAPRPRRAAVSAAAAAPRSLGLSPTPKGARHG